MQQRETDKKPNSTEHSEPQVSLDEIKTYVDAASAASDRGRLVLLVTITISVLAFSALWNARQESWLNSRLHMARISAIACKNDWDATKIGNQLRQGDKDLLARAHQYYDSRHFENCEHVIDVVKNLEEIQTKDVNQVKVPFFGSQFDTNDLGMFAGFAFAVSLIWFRYSLAREYANIGLCFRAAKKPYGHSRRTVYDLLAMRQVMTVPPPVEEDPILAQERTGNTSRQLLKKGPKGVRGFFHNFSWNKLSLVLYFLPLLVQFAIVRSDWSTSPLGDSISPHNRKIVTIAEILFLLLIIVLTFLSLRLAQKIDAKWEEMAKQYNSLSMEQARGERPL
jgi:hypothetical protein